jgi:hypothetical protein
MIMFFLYIRRVRPLPCTGYPTRLTLALYSLRHNPMLATRCNSCTNAMYRYSFSFGIPFSNSPPF